MFHFACLGKTIYMWTSFKAFFKSYTVIFVNSYFFLVCMLLFSLRTTKEDMFAITYSVPESFHRIYLFLRNSIQWIRTRGTEPKSNVWNNRLNDTFRLSCGEKIVIDIKFTTHTTMEIENMKRILNWLDI